MYNKKANHFQGCQKKQDINNRNYYTVTDAEKIPWKKIQQNISAETPANYQGYGFSYQS